MKSIKLKIVLWITVLLSLVGLCFAQDSNKDSIPWEEGIEIEALPHILSLMELHSDTSIPNAYDSNVYGWTYKYWDPQNLTETVSFEVKVSPEPLELTLESEPLEKNEALQNMLELEAEQTDALNQNLSELNKIIGNLPEYNINAKQAVLQQYGISPIYIAKEHKNITSLRIVLLTVWSIIFLVATEASKKLYWKKRNVWRSIFHLWIGIFLIYILTELLYTGIDGYYLWQNFDKFF